MEEDDERGGTVVVGSWEAGMGMGAELVLVVSVVLVTFSDFLDFNKSKI